MSRDMNDCAQTPAKDLRLSVPSMTCAGCMIRVERCLAEIDGVHRARANLSERVVTLSFDPERVSAEDLTGALTGSGFPAHLIDTTAIGHSMADQDGRDLLLRAGIAGFAAMNVMLLSISVWSGADDATRDLLHWVSALIALPTIAYAGQPFFRSALAALSAWRLNMDVPISLAVILAAAHSVVETANGGAHAYFDAGVMLLFFLLIGRYLEHRTRRAARSAAAELLRMTGKTARRVLPDGDRICVSVDDLRPDMEIEIAPGERIPVDGIVSKGVTEIDRSLLTGESRPEQIHTGDAVHAGMLNLSGAIEIGVTAVGDATVLAEIARLVDAAERGRGRYERIADRAARIYAPLVHILAAAAFVAWILITGDPHLATQIAVAVLIVTCPCALALAVPTVHTATTARLFGKGIFLKDGADLERLAEVDLVVFDKTGTLTDGTPRLIDGPAPGSAWPVAAALAGQSRHPFSRAIEAEAQRLGIVPADVCDIQELPGVGVEGRCGGEIVRLGRGDGRSSGSATVLNQQGRATIFRFAETLRKDAADTCQALKNKGLELVILSGDTRPAVDLIAHETGIQTSLAGLRPEEKMAWLQARASEGRRVLMVGDGLNDGPALAAAHASMSPASATDVAKSAAGFVFTTEGLAAVTDAHSAAVSARRRTYQSFAIAVAYNTVAVPLAMLGVITPLTAAIAMSTSSILVVLNAVRKGSNDNHRSAYSRLAVPRWARAVGIWLVPARRAV